MKLIWLIWILILVGELDGQRSKKKNDVCPTDEGFGITARRHRVGNGRYYILHGEDRSKVLADWNRAWRWCKDNGNMKLAILDKITTFAEVANYWRANKKSIYKDTWYWVAAKYDRVTEQYLWYSDMEGKKTTPISYTNYFYRLPRPTGIGSHYTFNYTYQPERVDIEQCLTFAYPWPINESVGQYGYNPTFDERNCQSRQRRHIMCEAPMECSAPDPGPYVLSEGKEDYFDSGNFIFGDRLYVVNWGQRDYPAAKKYCEGLGLEVYDPQKEDHCIIPFIKLWARNVSASQFWVGWSYNNKEQMFLNAAGVNQSQYHTNQGNNIEKQAPGYFDFNDKVDVEGRSAVTDRTLCVSLSHQYEFKVQLYCPDPNSLACQWHYITYAPSNCNNKQGVICQHKDYKKRSCTWRAKWIEKNRLYEGVKATAMVPFGFQTNKEYMRSTYKQTFGSLYCPPGYNMVRERNKEWLSFPSPLTEKDRFKYDFDETYWVVDKEKFQKAKGAKCTISKVVNKKRVLLKVPCTEWHFYLCKKRFKPPMVPKPAPPPGYKEPIWSWNDDRPTPRQYSF